jgi:hypothetical protein
MKILCETTGSFSLVDFGQAGAVIEAHRPSVVERSAFVSARAAVGQIRFLGDVTDEATDAEFAKYVDEAEDMDLAVSAFLAAFAVEDTSKKKVSGKRGRKAKDEIEGETETEE